MGGFTFSASQADEGADPRPELRPDQLPNQVPDLLPSQVPDQGSTQLPNRYPDRRMGQHLGPHLGQQLGSRLGPRLTTALPEAVPPAPPIGLPPISELRRFNTTRLLPAKYSESVLTRIADKDDLQLIYELDNATNDRLLAERNLRPFLTPRELVFDVQHYRIINAAFTHPHPQGGRFSMPYRGAWYAAFELATAKAEVLFHRALQFTEIGWTQAEELDYAQYLADFSGSFHDLRPEAFRGGGAFESGTDTLHAVAAGSPADFSACLDPASYVVSQRLAIHLLELGSLGILYPSTRRRGGHCIACFRPSVVANVRKRDLFRLTWYPDRAATFVRAQRARPG
jgi:hypothetical protein